jgi:multidrug efflux system outer membrane protein
VLLIAGCTAGPDYVRPPVPPVPEYRPEDVPAGESVANLPWWELFEDPVLQELIQAGLEENLNLRVSLARIDEARAALGIVRADLFPRLDYSAPGSVQLTTEEGSDATASASASLNASYQVDLWGRIRRSNEAALQELLATEEAYRGVTISLVAEIASGYFLLRDLDNRLLISEQTVESRRASLDVIAARFRAGVVSEVDVNQAEILVAGAEVSVQTFERLRVQTENALSVLLGRPPMDIARGIPLQEQVLPPELPTGLPSELLERRPDVLEAERRLHAQTARIGVAQALKYPQLNLTADLGGQFAKDLSLGFLDLGAQIFGPLFNAGENQRRVDVELARTEQLLSAYQQSILSAVRDVEDSLVAVRTYRLAYEAHTRQMVAAKNAAELSWARYDGGLTSYLEVLDLQRSEFSSQLAASEALQLQLTAIVTLFEALGGGWVAEQDSVNIAEYAPELAPPAGE